MRELLERIQYSGVSSLSEAELLSLVLHPSARTYQTVLRYQRLLVRHPLQELLRLDSGTLANEYSLGPVTAAKLQALLELSRRLTAIDSRTRIQIRSAQDAAHLVMSEMGHLDHEEMRVLLLDAMSHVKADLLLYRGVVNSSLLRIAEVFQPAITRKLPKIILCHNHPSDNLIPSEADITVTKRLVEAGKLLEIEVLDLLIIGHQRFLSLREYLHW